MDRSGDGAQQAEEGAVLLFDGVCNLCNGAVDFVLRHERAPTLRFAALQSAAGVELLRAHGLSEALETMVLVEAGRASVRSTAALRAARHLRAPWSWAFALLLLPRPLRDGVYRIVARNRLRWFGERETCRVPTPELRARFL